MVVHNTTTSSSGSNSDNYVVKIADLGVSRQLSEDTMMLQTFYGTPLYLSPELINNNNYNEKTDIWSLGVILYELVTLTHPFKSKTLLGLAKQVCQGKYDDINNITNNIYTNSISQCISWMLNINYKLRPNISQLLKFCYEQGKIHDIPVVGLGIGLQQFRNPYQIKELQKNQQQNLLLKEKKEKEKEKEKIII